jgi:hypothetical protein
LLVLALLSASVVASVGCVPKLVLDPVVEWCAKNEPHYFTPAEWAAKSESEQNFWIAHNERGERECGWEPLNP